MYCSELDHFKDFTLWPGLKTYTIWYGFVEYSSWTITECELIAPAK
jgi:hypothetical protein